MAALRHDPHHRRLWWSLAAERPPVAGHRHGLQLNRDLWATSGRALAALPMVGAATLWRSWTELDSAKAHRDAVLAGVWVGLGCLTRPDIHLIAAVLGLSLVARAALNRRLDRVLLGFALGGLLVTTPGHAFRYLYFGEWLPNTYYVKTGGGALVWLKGLQALHEMWDFNHIGLLALLAPLAFARRERLVEKLCLAAISMGYMAYIVKVGRDEMHWHRLYLPALPSLAILAGLGLQNVALALSRLVTARWNVAAAGARAGRWSRGWSGATALTPGSISTVGTAAATSPVTTTPTSASSSRATAARGRWWPSKIWDRPPITPLISTSSTSSA